MKKTIGKGYQIIKQVFTDVKNNFQGNSKYPLGEDFYTFDSEVKNAENAETVENAEIAEIPKPITKIKKPDL